MVFHGFSMVCFLNYMIPCFSMLFHAHLIFHNSLYHGFPCFFHGLVLKLNDTMLSMLFPCFYKIRKHGNSMEKQGNHGKTFFHAFSTRVRSCRISLISFGFKKFGFSGSKIFTFLGSRLVSM